MNTACAWVHENDPPEVAALLGRLTGFFTQHPRPHACFHSENVRRQSDELLVTIAHSDAESYELLMRHFGGSHIVWDGDRDDGQLVAIVKLGELGSP